MFQLDEKSCVGCGLCVADCPVAILAMREGFPFLAPKKEQFCLDCQHCALVCPQQAVAIANYQPESRESLAPIAENAALVVDTLLARRRSMRAYRKEEVDDKVIDALCTVAWQAPRGRNRDGLRFSVVRSRRVMEEIRDHLLQKIERSSLAGTLAKKHASYAKFPKAWQNERKDFLFCNAPHFLLVSATAEAVTPMQDAIIALTTFEFAAQSYGLGTLWNGIATTACKEIAPELLPRLGVGEGAQLCYLLCFGHPARRYSYRAQRGATKLYTIE